MPTSSDNSTASSRISRRTRRTQRVGRHVAIPAGSPPPPPRVWPGLGPTLAEQQRDRVIIPIALAATVILHLIFLFGPPADAFFPESERQAPATQEYEVIMEQPEPEEMRFVQTNPDVPQNPPDSDTRNFAARDQQAAQPEDADPRSRDEFPTVDGEMRDATQIVEGDLMDPVPPAPPPTPAQEHRDADRTESASPERPEAPQSDALAVRPEIQAIPEEYPRPSPPDFLQQEPEDEEGLAATSGPVGEDDTPLEEESERRIPITAPLPVQPDPEMGEFLPPSVEQESTAPQESVGDPQEAMAEERPTPRPRPRLRPNVVPSPLIDSSGAASRAGAIAVDANFSDFGDYLQRMVEAVSRQWNARANEVTLLRERPSMVRLRFTLDYRGNVTELRVIDKDANAGYLATSLCMDAVQERSPYSPWTRDMIRTLGLEQEMTFTFYYR